MEIYKKIDYKNGYSINIYYDEIAESPAEWGDDTLFLTGFNREFTPDQKYITRDLQADIFAELNGDADDYEEREQAREWVKNYFIFPLFAYIHSGVALSLGRTGQFADKWDSSTVGAVYAKKTKFDTEEEARTAADSLVKTWDNVLSGQVFGYMIETPDESTEGGCWGFIGEPEESGLIEQAKEEADELIKEDKRKAVEFKKMQAEDKAELLKDMRAGADELIKRLNKHKKNTALKVQLARNLNSIQSIIDKNL